MLVSDIVRRVRETAGDTAVLQFSNATVTDWINDGIRECVQINSLLQTKGTAVMTAGQRTYTLPTDVFKLHSILADTDFLEYITLNEWESRNYDLTAVGTPQVACVYAGNLDLYPIPDKNGTLYINYTKSPTEIAYTATPESYAPATPAIPVAFHSRLVTYCLAQVALQDDDYPKYQAMMQEFTTGVVDLNHLKNQTEAVYPSITYVEWE